MISPSQMDFSRPIDFSRPNRRAGILPDELPRVLVLKGGNPRSFRVDELGSDRGPQAHTRAGLDAQPSTPSPILATPVPLAPPSPTLTPPHPPSPTLTPIPELATWLSSLESGTTFYPTFEYEGNWGLPARYWRQAKALVPALRVLDGLPAFTFVALAALLVACGVVKILLMDLEPAPTPESFLSDQQRLGRVKEE